MWQQARKSRILRPAPPIVYTGMYFCLVVSEKDDDDFEEYTPNPKKKKSQKPAPQARKVSTPGVQGRFNSF